MMKVIHTQNDLHVGLLKADHNDDVACCGDLERKDIELRMSLMEWHKSVQK
jgi:hypothetical protein